MHGAPEILSWPATDGAVAGRATGGSPVDDWVDFGDLGDLGAGSPLDDRRAASGAGQAGHATKVVWAVVVLAALAALVVPSLHPPETSVGGLAVRTDMRPPSYPAWVPPIPQPSLPQLMALAARSPQPLKNHVRTGWTRGGCPHPLPRSSSPVTRAMRSVAASMPGFRLVDSSRLTDQFGELCLVQLRARNAKGTVLVMNIVPPQEWPGIHSEPLVTLQSGGGGTAYARTVSETTTTGWRIEIGAVGTSAKLPTLTDLSAVTDDPTLTW